MNDSAGAGAFAAPAWLRSAGKASWLLVGILLVGVGAVTLLAITHVIVMPVLAATVAAAVASPLVSWLERHGIPRLPGTILLLLAVALLAALVVYLVITGITSQTSDIEGHLDDAKGTLSGWLEDLGADSGTAAEAESEASSSASGAASALLGGVAVGISALSSVGFFLALTILCLIFMLKDGREIRAWVESHMGLPAATARRITQRALEALRNYFLGTTIVADLSQGRSDPQPQPT
jgi:putative heme transporter